MENLTETIRRHLLDYLAGATSYDEFTDWMYGVTWNLDQRGDAAASHLGYGIMLEIAEFSNGDATSDEFRSGLQALIEPATARASA
ncbi:MAG: hypothetical protein QM692_18495 [Thermomicrobiales bacterium]